MSTVLDHPLDDPAAWNAVDLAASPQRWTHILNVAQGDEIQAAVAHLCMNEEPSTPCASHC
jgi:hypothetical protein